MLQAKQKKNIAAKKSNCSFANYGPHIHFSWREKAKVEPFLKPILDFFGEGSSTTATTALVYY
jgi:hypothetical protein